MIVKIRDSMDEAGYSSAKMSIDYHFIAVVLNVKYVVTIKNSYI